MISISVCMIVKDEETNLSKCLDSIYGKVDEIVIVDTGSTDSTKEIASRYTDKVIDYKWNKSFADARNFSISIASNEYILVIDSDEIVVDINLQKINQQILTNPKRIGRIIRVNEYSRDGKFYKYNERVNRLFSKKYYKYEGKIHEQVTPNDKSIIADTYHIPLTIIHSGYEGNIETRKKKTHRNIELLLCALQEKPDEPYLIYQLGKSYYMEEEYMVACNYFERALTYDIDVRLEYVQDLVESYGYSLININQYERALLLLNVYNEFAHSADFIFLIALILMNNGKYQESIEEFLKATRRKECKMEGVNNYLAYYNIGVIFECLGNIEQAIQYYKMCEDYELARTRLYKIS